MTQTIPPFPELVREAEKRLSRLLGGRCVISIHRELDDNLRTVIQTIDHEKFRQELWYSTDELDTRTRKRGFLCLLASLDGRAVAFDYGYEDEAEDTFFSDTTATLIEGKRVGSTLFALEILHSYHRGYKRTKQTTEELDEKGRPLTRIWGRLGFETVSTDPSGSVEMVLVYTPQRMRMLYEKYIRDEQ
jgi:hypothetical protein